MSAAPHLDALTARGRAFLGSRHAILAGAMSWVSERHLVSAISNAGGFGSNPGGFNGGGRGGNMNGGKNMNDNRNINGNNTPNNNNVQ